VNWLKKIFGNRQGNSPISDSTELARNTALARNVEYVEGEIIDEPDPRLHEIMREISRSDTPEPRHELLRMLRQTTLLVLSPDASTTPGMRRIERGETVNLAITEGHDGSDYVPVFTTTADLHNYLHAGGIGYFPIDAIALMEMLDGSETNIVLDPGSAHSVTVRAHEFEELLRHMN